MVQPVKQDGWAIVAAAFVGVQVGAATVASRFALTEMDAATLGAFRYAIGVLVLFPVLVMSIRVRFQRSDILPIMLLGLLQFAGLVTLLNIALTLLPAARVALVFSTFPLLTMLIGRILGREIFSVWKVVGVLLTFIGVAIVLSDKLVAWDGFASMAGDTYALAAAFCGAICSVLYRPYVTKYSPLAVGVFSMATSAIALAGVAWLLGGFGGVGRITTNVWAATIFVGVSSGAGFWSLLWAFARAAPTRVVVFQALAPVVATALGVLLLDEPLEARFMFGLAAVCLGIAVAHRDVNA
ncbi:MAG: DMT family transporter [Hyphomicrobiaceae bacterium]|nr:DMT family transporter [Hyphomicrobiaceae bacterium]